MPDFPLCVPPITVQRSPSLRSGGPWSVFTRISESWCAPSTINRAEHKLLHGALSGPGLRMRNQRRHREPYRKHEHIRPFAR